MPHLDPPSLDLPDLAADFEAAALDKALAHMVAVHGPWGSHNLALPFGRFTIGPEPRGDNYRTVKFLQLVQDVLRRPLGDLRVIDLGCGEGLYALEFAQHGAEVVGVEGRIPSLAKAEFCRRVFGLETLRFLHGDVRAVNRADYGAFDVVLCSGILYHLDQPAMFDFLKAMRHMCEGVLIIDTRIASTAEVEVVYDGKVYRGSKYREHVPGATETEKLADMGASLDNDESFWIVKHDLANALMDLGFTSVMECLAPVPWMLRKDRVTLVATAGRKAAAYNEIGLDLAGRRWPPFWDVLDPSARA
jgi:SAM-dependent methyltransferase